MGGACLACLFRFVSDDPEPDGLLLGLRTGGFAEPHPGDFTVGNDDALVVLRSEPHGRHRRCAPGYLERLAIGESDSSSTEPCSFVYSSTDSRKRRSKKRRSKPPE